MNSPLFYPGWWKTFHAFARGCRKGTMALLLALAASEGQAATGPGSPDPAFLANFDPGPNPVLRQLAVDTQDRVLVSGDYEVFRLLPDGTLDNSFPKSPTDDWIFTLVPTSDGGLYVGGRFRHFRGESHAGIVKLKANGDIDTAFRPSSEGPRDVYAIASHPEGGLIIGGYFDYWEGVWVRDLVRLLPDASLDRAFTANQAPIQDGFRTPVDPRILMRGDGTFLVQRGQIEVVSWDGHLRATYPATGAWAALDADRVAVAETVYDGGQVGAIRVFVIRNDGTVDPSFQVMHDIDGPARTLAVQSDGRLLVGGNFSVLGGQRHHGLARLNTDGSIDGGFVSEIGATTSAVWQNQGGSIWVNEVQTQKDGTLLACGYFTNVGATRVTSVARLLGGVRASSAPAVRQSGGAVTMTEGHSARLGFSVESVAPFGGTWTKDGVTLPAGVEPVLRLGNLKREDAGRYQLRLTNAMGEILCPAVDLQVAIGPTHPGSVDVSFRAGTVDSDEPGPNSGPVRGAVSAGDRIYIFSKGSPSGLISSVDGHSTLGMARLGLDGQVDRAFVMMRGSTHAARLLGVQSVLPLADGRVLAQITLPAASPIRRTTNVIVALHPDGSPDETFSVAVQPWSLSSVISPLGLAPNGGILVGGLIRWDGDSQIRTVVRLRADGSVDPAFRPIEGSQTPSSVLWQSTGRLLVISKDVTASGRSVGVVKRYLADGTSDPTFRVDPPIEALIAGAVVDDQDRLLISFASNSTDSVTGSLILRLLPEGGRDLSFAEIRVPNGFSFQTYHSLSLQSDGRILAIPSAVGPKTSVVRWLPDGRPDPEFQLELDGSFETVGVISGDRILIAGSFAEQGGTERRGVAILNGVDERRWEGAQWREGTFEGRIRSRPQRRYVVEAADNPGQNSWEVVQTLVGDGSSLRFRDVSVGHRFYRLRLE